MSDSPHEGLFVFISNVVDCGLTQSLLYASGSSSLLNEQFCVFVLWSC